jgi:hypothetical protein
MVSLANGLRDWHEFYNLIGSAAATLIGLMFVAASIGAGVFTREDQAGIRSFLSPTVVHFSAVLTLCLVGSIPNPSWSVLGGLTIVIGLAGLAYSGWVLRRMIKHGIAATIDVVDRLWYAFLPIIAYSLLALCGISFFRRTDGHLEYSRSHSCCCCSSASATRGI